MVRLGNSASHEDDVDYRVYMETLAKELVQGDLLQMNCAPDARVLNVETSKFQTILDIRHANGDEGSLSRDPNEKVKILKR